MRERELGSILSGQIVKRGSLAITQEATAGVEDGEILVSVPQRRQYPEQQGKVAKRHRQQKSHDQKHPLLDERSHRELLKTTDSIIPSNDDVRNSPLGPAYGIRGHPSVRFAGDDGAPGHRSRSLVASAHRTDDRGDRPRPPHRSFLLHSRRPRL